jgi:hypothetical protein
VEVNPYNLSPVITANKADGQFKEADYDELEEERISLINASVYRHWMQNKEPEVECGGKSIQLVSSYSS